MCRNFKLFQLKSGLLLINPAESQDFVRKVTKMDKNNVFLHHCWIPSKRLAKQTSLPGCIKAALRHTCLFRHSISTGENWIEVFSSGNLESRINRASREKRYSFYFAQLPFSIVGIVKLRLFLDKITAD